MAEPATTDTGLRIGTTEETLLRCAALLVVFTALQATRFAFSVTSLRFVQKRLSRLVAGGYLVTAAGYTTVGRPPTVYGLSSKGWAYVATRFGLPKPRRWNKAELADRGFSQYQHDLCLADAAVCFKLACDRFPNQLSLHTFRHERLLEQATVTLPDGTSTQVRPDAFVELHIRRGQTWNRRNLLLEIDLGTEAREDVIGRLTARLGYLGRIYESQFPEAGMPTFLYLTPLPRRRDLLLKWAEAALVNSPEQAMFFRFAGVDPGRIEPSDLLFSPLWQAPFVAEPVSLLPALLPLQEG